jgi:acyl carrier protein
MGSAAIEERVTALVAAVLGKDSADIDDTFRGGLADLGYTSLQALQLNRIFEEEFECKINILDIVDARSIEEVCALISRTIRDRSGAHSEGS